MKKGCLTSLFTIVIIVGLVAGGALYLLGSPKNVDVKWTDKDFDSGLKKAKLSIQNMEAINALNLIKGDFKTKGSNKVNAIITSKEMSALVTKANQNSGPITDVKIRFLNNNELEHTYRISESAIEFIKNKIILNRMAVFRPYGSALAINSSSSLSDFLIGYITNAANNKPVYSKGVLQRTSPNSIHIKIQTIKVGQVPLPEDIVKQVEMYTESIVNNIISKENGFSIEELRIENGQLYYKGTLPAEITGSEIK